MKSRLTKSTISFLSWGALLGLSGCEMATYRSHVSLSSNKSWSVATMTRLKSELKGTIDSSLLGNHLAVRISEDERHLIISLPAPNLFQSWERDIPQLPGAELKALITPDGRSYLELHYPLHLLISDFKGMKALRLPNGAAIPGIPEGQAPGVTFDIDKEHKVNIFFSKGVVTLLLNVPFDPILGTKIAIKNKLGNVYTIPKEDSSPGGILLTLVLPPSIMKILEGE